MSFFDSNLWSFLKFVSPVIVVVALFFMLRFFKDQPIETLPFAITAEYHAPGDGVAGFTLVHSDGFTAVGPGLKYWGSDIEVDSFVSYSQNADTVIAKVSDKGSTNLYYILFTKPVDEYGQPHVTIISTDSLIIGTKFSFRPARINN